MLSPLGFNCRRLGNAICFWQFVILRYRKVLSYCAISIVVNCALSKIFFWVLLLRGWCNVMLYSCTDKTEIFFFVTRRPLMVQVLPPGTLCWLRSIPDLQGLIVIPTDSKIVCPNPGLLASVDTKISPFWENGPRNGHSQFDFNFGSRGMS